MKGTILILLYTFLSIIFFAYEKVGHNKLQEDILFAHKKADKSALLPLDLNHIEDKVKTKEGFHGFQRFQNQS